MAWNATYGARCPASKPWRPCNPEDAVDAEVRGSRWLRVARERQLVSWEAISANMKVDVIAYGYLMTLLGGKRTVDLKDDAQLADLTAKLAASVGGVKTGHLGPYNVATDLIVLINGRNVKALTTPYALTEGDVVTFIPPYVGG